MVFNIGSFVVLLVSTILFVGDPVFGAQLACSSDYGITLSNLVLRKNGAVVSGIDWSGGEYIISGNINVSPGASVQSIDVKYDMYIKASVKLLPFLPASQFTVSHGCAPCTLAGITCSQLESLYSVSNICGANSEVSSGSHSFQDSMNLPDMSSSKPSGLQSSSAILTIQYFDSSNGGQIGCLRIEIPLYA